MGRIAKKIDFTRLKLLKQRIENQEYQQKAVQGIAEVLTHFLFQEPEKKRSWDSPKKK